MTVRAKSILRSLGLAASLAVTGALAPFRAEPDAEPVDFLMVSRTLEVSGVRLTALNDAAAIQRERSPVKVSDCIALINPSPTPSTSKSTGRLSLADGQRFPGEPAETTSAKAGGEVFAWNHPWLGRMEVPLKLIQTIALQSGANTLPPAASDAIVLLNGDRYDGFIMALGQPVSIEVDQGGRREVINIPLDRIATISMITPRQQPKGRRIWFGEGTVLDVQSITVGDDGVVRLGGSTLVPGTQVTRMGLGEIAAILFDGKALLPLATIAPSRIEGPVTRYVVPKPRVMDGSAPLDLSRIELRGPVVARYALPAGVTRLAAEAALPEGRREWGDCEVVVRSDDTEVFRARLNGATPSASINVPLAGRELTIEVTQGAHGPIQDTVVLKRAMLLRRN